MTAAVYEARENDRTPPTEYCGGVSGRGIVVYDPDAYRAAKAAGTLAEKPYVHMGWPETARSATNDWAGRMLPWLESLATGRPLRLVLGFDS